LLASQFGSFIPLAIVSLGVSTGACALAAAQAMLPPNKRRPWSRPLVGLLFFLQPVVRGWARFKWRLNLLAASKPILMYTSKPAADRELPEVFGYWTDRPLDRYRFLECVLSKLDQASWSFKTDTGWKTCDLEIPVDFWTRLTFTTACEELGQGKKNFQCRIRSFWSLPAKLVFWDVAAGLALLVAFFAVAVPWVWMSLLILPLLAWAFEERRFDYEDAFVKLLDEVAREQGLVKLKSESTTSPTSMPH
jgi:hypothetical protein